jgi:hypothetical protein
MTESFFERPILNSPYEIPRLHHALDKDGPRMLINVETLKAYYASLPVKGAPVANAPRRRHAASISTA